MPQDWIEGLGPVGGIDVERIFGVDQLAALDRGGNRIVPGDGVCGDLDDCDSGDGKPDGEPRVSDEPFDG